MTGNDKLVLVGIVDVLTWLVVWRLQPAPSDPDRRFRLIEHGMRIIFANLGVIVINLFLIVVLAITAAR